METFYTGFMIKYAVTVFLSFLVFSFLVQNNFAQAQADNLADNLKEKTIRIGVVAPDGGSLDFLARQFRAGFLLYQQNDVKSDFHFEILEETETCTSENGADIASNLQTMNVDLVIGFLCVESLVAAMPVFKQAEIPVINVNIRSDIIRDEAARLGWPLFSLAPRSSDLAKFASQYIIDHWNDKSVALIEDGTIGNRKLIDAIRLHLENGGFQAVVLDNFRSGQDKQSGLVRRLKRSGTSHIFIGADRLDISVIARDAASIGLELTIAGGEALRAIDENLTLPNGIIAILPQIDLVGEHGVEIRTRFDEAGIFPDHFPVLGYAMAELATLLSNNPFFDIGSSDMISLIKETRFKTVIGPISFNQYGERIETVFDIMVWQDDRFVKQIKR